MKVCRICLSKDGRLYPITSNGLRSLYHQLTGLAKLEMDVDRRLPQWVCAECGLRLLSYNKLRQKSLRAHQILTNLLNKGDYITEESINQIDRIKNDLTSNLSHKVLDNGTKQNNKQDSKHTNKQLEKDEFYIQIEPEFIKLEKDIDSSKYISEENSIGINDTSLKNDPLSDAESSNLENLENDESSFSKYSSLSKCSSVKRKRTKRNLDKKCKRIQESVKKKRPKKEVVKKKVVHKDREFEKLFSVKVLSMEEQIEEMSNRQFAASYINAPYKCVHCYVGILSEDVFVRHLKRHTDESGKFSCDLCKKRFITNARLNTHIKSHSTIYSCKQCNFNTRARCLAVQHGLRHKGHQYQCPHCGVNFDNSSSYFFHLKIKHVSTNFVCEYCGFAFLSAKGVVQHKSLVHGLHKDSKIEPIDGPTCPTCNIKFASDEALARHEGISHSETPAKRDRNELVRAYQCEICGSKARDRKAFQNHYLTHFDGTSTEQLPNLPSDSESILNLENDESPNSSSMKTEKNLENDEKNLENDEKHFENDEKYLENEKNLESDEFKFKKKRAKKAIVKKIVVERNKDLVPVDDLFTVQILSMDEQIAEMINRQYSAGYIEAPFKCIDCYIGFLSEKVLVRHRLRHSDESGKFMCELCKRRFPTKARHSSHMKTHRIIYSCTKCNFTTRARYVTMEHRLKHEGHAYECPHCGKKLQNRSSYFLHLKIKHVVTTNFVCQYCGFAFGSAKGVNQHKNLVHGINKYKETVPPDGPTCSTCNIKFASDEALAKHEDISHPQIPGHQSRNAELRAYVCKICGLRTNDARAFKIHCLQHSEDGDEMSTKYVQTNVTSTRRSDGRIQQPAVCVPCGREFKNEITLAKHAVVHSGVKPFQCDECNRKFAVKKACKIHIMKMHMPKRPRLPKPQNQSEVKYLCSVCGKEFASLGNMTIHLARHSDHRPFACEVCGKLFKTNSEVDSHTLHVHLKKPWPRTKRSTNTL